MSSDFVPAPVGAGVGQPEKPKRKPRPSELKRKAERAAAAKAKEVKSVETKAEKPAKKVKKARKARKAGRRASSPKGIRAFLAPLRAREKDLARQLKVVQSLIKRTGKLVG
jgi:hypothetical protein